MYIYDDVSTLVVKSIYYFPLLLVLIYCVYASMATAMRKINNILWCSEVQYRHLILKIYEYG